MAYDDGYTYYYNYTWVYILTVLFITGVCLAFWFRRRQLLKNQAPTNLPIYQTNMTNPNQSSVGYAPTYYPQPAYQYPQPAAVAQSQTYPENYPPPPYNTAPKSDRYTIMYSYTAQASDELSVVPGQQVKVFEAFPNGWCKVLDIATESVGHIPLQTIQNSHLIPVSAPNQQSTTQQSTTQESTVQSTVQSQPTSYQNEPPSTTSIPSNHLTSANSNIPSNHLPSVTSQPTSSSQPASSFQPASSSQPTSPSQPITSASSKAVEEAIMAVHAEQSKRNSTIPYNEPANVPYNEPVDGSSGATNVPVTLDDLEEEERKMREAKK